MGSSAPDLLAPKGQSDCERLTNIFVLDTGPLSALRDQDLRLGGRDALESRLVGQVAAMKLLCCAELPDKVGVLRMGASDACVDVRPTERWHSADGLGRRALDEEEDPGFLCCYRPDPEPADTSVPNPRRLARALRLALAELTDSGYESWKDSDLYVEKEQRARITMFLCGPALGLKGVEEDFRAAVAEVDSRDVELEILLHRSAYSPSFDQYGSPTQPKGELASGGVQISPLELRCSEADMATLSYAMDANFRHKIAAEGHVTTLSAYSKTYLPGVRDERREILLARLLPFCSSGGSWRGVPRSSVDGVVGERVGEQLQRRRGERGLGRKSLEGRLSLQIFENGGLHEKDGCRELCSLCRGMREKSRIVKKYKTPTPLLTTSFKGS